MDWMDSAACRADGVDPEGWFPTTSDLSESRAAIKICRTCPVQAECLQYAKRIHPTAGIWAGISADRIHHLRKKETA